MRVCLVLLFWFLAAETLPAEEAWIFLKDGRIGQGRTEEDTVAMTFPDGKTEKLPKAAVRETVSFDVINRKVDGLLESAFRNRGLSEEMKQRIADLGAAAVPRLLSRLSDRDKFRRLIALMFLQYAWSPAARGPVIAILGDPDPAIRQTAGFALQRGEKSADLARLLAPYAQDPNPAIAAFALEHQEEDALDPANMRRLLEKKESWKHVVKFLPRCHAPELIPGTLRMLREGKDEEKAAALAALIHQNDDTDSTRRLVLKSLREPSALVREYAAEYLTWHGKPADLPEMEKLQQKEGDRWTGASLAAAVKAVRRREGRIKKGTPDTASEKPAAVKGRITENYTNALGQFRKNPTPDRWREAFEIYRSQEVCEPVWKYKKTPDPEFLARIEARAALQAELFAIPGFLPDTACAYDGSDTYPVAESLMPPVRDCFDPRRKSYGLDVGGTAEAFANSVHVGDDVGWNRDHGTVTAVGDGIVRFVRTGYTWGGHVIIEHRGPDGTVFCSLYAHLSPFLHVRPGEIVKKGQKIGAIGRSFTWENGGYGAHLHLGIHQGPYQQTFPPGKTIKLLFQGRMVTARVVRADRWSAVLRIEGEEREIILPTGSHWIRGYVDPAEFREGKHGWVNPREFFEQWKRGAAGGAGGEGKRPAGGGTPTSPSR